MYGTGIKLVSDRQETVLENLSATGTTPKRVLQLLVLQKAFREFVYLRVEFGNGDVRYYINEWHGTVLSEVEDDELFDELARFVDEHHERLRPEGSSV